MFHVPCFSLTTHCRIQDSVFVTQVADESRSSGPQRNRSALYGPSPFRGPARDVFHLSPIHRGAVDVQQRSYEWRPPVEYPDPALTSSPVQPDPSYGFVASGLPWDIGVRNPSAAGSLLPNVGGSPPPINIQILSWPHGVLAWDPFTSYPNSVSGETTFPQNNGPLIQSHHPPHYAGRLGPPVEYPLLNHIQLSRSGSQGPPLNNVRGEMSTRWRCLTLDFLIIHSHSFRHSKAVDTTVIPLSLRQRGCTWSLRDHTQRRETAGNISQLFSM